MSRREFIAPARRRGCVAAPGARAAPTMPVIGFLQSGSPDATAHMVAAFHSGLKEAGYVEGQSVGIVYRYADGQYDRLPVLAAELTYAATKGGLVSMVRSIAADLAPRKAPGATKTPIWKRGVRAMPRQRNPQKFPTSSLPRFHLPDGASRKIWPRLCFFLPRTTRRTSTRSS